MVRNESVRFGRHMDIEVSYKIGNTKIGFNFALSGLFSKGAVWRQFCQKNTLRPLRVKYKCLNPIMGLGFRFRFRFYTFKF
jgi:hypothetical protein